MITNVILSVGKADKLSAFVDNSFDILFTDATLLYIAPDKIKEVISEMIRIARKALIFVEQHEESLQKDPRGEGVYDSGIWKRNYRRLR